MKRWFRETWAELRARSAGRKAMGNDKSTFQSTRGAMGAIGMNFSNAWELLEKDNGAYLRSLQKEAVLPPSIFVSERDRLRHGDATPLVERCIEDHGNPEALEVRDWDISRVDESPGVDLPAEVNPQPTNVESTEGRSPDLHG